MEGRSPEDVPGKSRSDKIDFIGKVTCRVRDKIEGPGKCLFWHASCDRLEVPFRYVMESSVDEKLCLIDKTDKRFNPKRMTGTPGAWGGGDGERNFEDGKAQKQSQAKKFLKTYEAPYCQNSGFAFFHSENANLRIHPQQMTNRYRNHFCLLRSPLKKESKVLIAMHPS